MRCPKCKCENVTIQMVEAGSKTKKSSVGLGGHAYNTVRGMASVATLGLAGLVMPKAKGKEKSKTQMVKMALCQDCGNSWEVK